MEPVPGLKPVLKSNSQARKTDLRMTPQPLTSKAAGGGGVIIVTNKINLNFVIFIYFRPRTIKASSLNTPNRKTHRASVWT